MRRSPPWLERFTKLAAQKAELEELDARNLLAQHEEEVVRMKKELEDAKVSAPKTLLVTVKAAKDLQNLVATHDLLRELSRQEKHLIWENRDTLTILLPLHTILPSSSPTHSPGARARLESSERLAA